jgi:putative hydrolase of the HAD superfamily
MGETDMALRAVIFDYGKVLSALPDAESHSNLVAATGLDDGRFEDHYWAHRHAYDSGAFNSVTYWEKIAADAGFEMNPERLQTLIENDCRMWGNLNQPMVDWTLRLLESGLRVAVLSNMGDATRDYLLKENDWLKRLDHLTWSCELLMAKPDPAIYTYTLDKLRVNAEEAIFIDDIPRNIEAARALGIDGILFTDVVQLRADLTARGLEGKIPFPIEG